MINLHKYIAQEVKLLKISGFYPEKIPTVMPKVRAFLVILITNFCTILFYLDFNNADQNTFEFTSCTLYAVGTSFVSWKFMAFIKTQRNILKLEEILTNPILCEFSETNEEIFENIVNSKFFIICKGIGVALSTIVNCMVLERGFKRKLYLPMKLYGSLENDTNCLYHVILQIIFMSIVTCNYVLIDVLCCKMISIATATLIILENNLKHVPYGNQDFQSLKKILKKNIILHREIMRYISHMEYTFSYVILTIILSGVFVICICGIIILKIDLSLAEASTVVLFFSCLMNQLAIYCWFGQQIMTKSVEISTGSYMTEWYTADIKIRKYLVIFMERVKKPIIIRAGYFFPLNVETLASILRSSYSAFTVLQQFYKD